MISIYKLISMILLLISMYFACVCNIIFLVKLIADVFSQKIEMLIFSFDILQVDISYRSIVYYN